MTEPMPVLKEFKCEKPAVGDAGIRILMTLPNSNALSVVMIFHKGRGMSYGAERDLYEIMPIPRRGFSIEGAEGGVEGYQDMSGVSRWLSKLNRARS